MKTTWADWLRSILAIGLGIVATGLLLHFTVDPVRATIARAVAGDPARVLTVTDWAYLAAMSAARYAPFAIGGALAGLVAPPDRVMHALVAVNLAIALWMAGVI